MDRLLEKGKQYVEFWPMLTFLVFVLGYIGFYTYCTQNGISYAKTDLSIIVGIGLYNLIIIFFLFHSGSNNKPSFLRIFLNTNYINFLVINPVIIGLLVLIDIQIYVGKRLTRDKKEICFHEKRKLVLQRRRRKLNLEMYIELLIILVIIAVSLFVNKNYFWMVSVVFFISYLFYYLKQNLKRNIYILFLVSLFIPVLTSTYYLKDINFTIIGLSREYSEVKTKGGILYKGMITYKTDNEIFINSNSKKLVIPYDEIEILVKIDTLIRPEIGLNAIIRNFKELKK